MARPRASWGKSAGQLSVEDLDALRAAQRVTRELCWAIVRRIEPGMREEDGYAVAREAFRERGLRTHWHLPYIGFGAGTTKLRSLPALLSSPLHGRRRLLADDMVMVDIAPEIEGVPSDYTVTAVVGTHSEREALCAFARETAQSLVELLAQGTDAAELMRAAQELVASRPGHRLGQVPVIHLGHRLERMPRWWPRVPESRLLYLMLDERPTFLNGRRAVPVRGMWMIEPYVLHAGRAAKHEEFVFVDDAGQVSTLNPPAT